MCLSDSVVVWIAQSELRSGAVLHTVSFIGDRTAQPVQRHPGPQQFLYCSEHQHFSVLRGKQPEKPLVPQIGTETLLNMT